MGIDRMGLTPKPAQLLDFIEAYHAAHAGVSPSFDEMRIALELKSKAGVARHIKVLAERGFIKRSYNRARALEVVGNREMIATLSNIPSHILVNELMRRQKT